MGYTTALAKPCGSSIANVDEKSAEKFYDWFLTRKFTHRTVKERLTNIREVWNWAIEKNYLTENPWLKIPNRVKVPPKQKPKPFTIEEIKTIISSFRNNRYYSYYTDYVEFLVIFNYQQPVALGDLTCMKGQLELTELPYKFLFIQEFYQLDKFLIPFQSAANRLQNEAAIFD